MTRLRSISRMTSLAIAVTVTLGSMVALSSVAQAAPRLTSTPVPGHFVVDDARIHYEPDRSSPSAGLGYLDHSVTLYCRTYSLAFYHLRDNTTGVEGWSSD